MKDENEVVKEFNGQSIHPSASHLNRTRLTRAEIVNMTADVSLPALQAYD